MTGSMSMIRDVPILKPEIKEAYEKRSLAIFLGAGVSYLAGCKRWDEMARNLVYECHRKKGRCIGFRERESLLQERDYKKVITICYKVLRNNGREDDFWTTFDAALEPSESNEELAEAMRIYRYLRKLDVLYLTTNADELFDKLFDTDDIACVLDDFRATDLETGRLPHKLYHLHGRKGVRDSLVFRVSEYMKRYNKPKFQGFLRTVFDQYTVLFIGYGMSEYEVIDYLVTKTNPSGAIKPAFLLEGFYKGEENLFKTEQEYYNDLGVQLIPYAKDENGYEQLFEVLEEWTEQIGQTPRFLLDLTVQLEALVDAV